jgi:hypothetical protein
VQIVREDFDLRDVRQAAEFLLSLYNYEKYARQKENSFDSDRSNGLKKHAALYMHKMKSYTSQQRQSKQTSKTEGKDRSENIPMSMIDEREEPEFHSSQTIHKLKQMNCRYIRFVVRIDTNPCRCLGLMVLGFC